ncbi:MAG: spermidine/putrescine transport system permease protein [Tepidanaerobacteraceae bacterium]|nr:spermidine/putrescine transport system permease protein [Tepidanaerobacteraceae bacterium]
MRAGQRAESIKSIICKEHIKENQKGHIEKGLLFTLSPIIIWVILFIVLPLALVIIISFMSRGTYGNIEYKFTLENYMRMFNGLYGKILWRSLVISFLTTVFCIIFGYPFAYFVANVEKKYRSMLLMMIIIPFWTNSLIRTYAWIILLRTQGIINFVLLRLGIIDEPLKLLYNNGTILLGLIYALFPFMVMPLYASIEKLDHTYLEVASDLGAKPWNAFLKVTLPLTMPGVITGSILVFIPTLGYFFIPDLLGGSKIMLVSNLIKNQFLTARDWPFGSALSIILIILTLVLIELYVHAASGDKKKIEVF